MNRKFFRVNSKGSVLILILWALGMLSVFALNLGINVRQKMTLLKRLEERSQLQLLAKAGVRKAIAVIADDEEDSKSSYSLRRKILFHNNRSQFSKISLAQGTSEISYVYVDHIGTRGVKKYGVIDEQSKININMVGVSELQKLIRMILGYDEEAAENLARNIIDWREYGRSGLGGFLSDDYYQNLQYPYEPKSADFEIIDELLLIKGVNHRVFNVLANYLTVYGEGAVNINTASRAVLVSVGFDEGLVDKILDVRKGPDRIEFTVDDHIFDETHNIGSDLKELAELSNPELAQIDTLNFDGKLATKSSRFIIKSTGRLAKSGEKKVIICVFNAKDDKIEYWREI